ERGDRAGDWNVLEAIGRDNNFRFSLPRPPDGGLRRAEQNDARHAEGCRHVRWSTVVPYKQRGLRDERLHAIERLTKDLVFEERAGVIAGPREEHGFDIPKLKIAGQFAKTLGGPRLFGR